MAQILDLGKIRFNWAGTYSSSVQYEYNDLVKYGPNLYAFTAAAAATNVVPTNTGSWTRVVEGIAWRSLYATSTLYYKNDVVTDSVSTFICTVEHTATDADINDNENFSLLALGQDDLPSQLGQVNKVLSSDGTDPFWTGTTKLTKGYWGSGQGNTAETVEGSAGYTNSVSVFAASVNDFAQFSFVNTSNGAGASTDFIAYTESGDNDSGFIDMGITSSQFSDPDFTITGPNDGYIFMSGPRGTTTAVLLKQVLSDVATLTTSGAHGFVVGNTIRVEDVSEELDGEKVITGVPAANKIAFAAVGVSPFVETSVDPVGTAYRPVGDGNLVLATDASGLTNAIIFAAGGFYSNRTQMAIFPDEMVHIEIQTESTTPSTGALVVAGGAGITGNVNVDGYVMTNVTAYVGPDAKDFEVSAGLSDIIIAAREESDSFVQIAMVNGTAGTESSADFIAYSNAGTNTNGWIDMGITNTAFDSETYGITGPGDGYIFMSGVAPVTVNVTTKSRAANVATLAFSALHKAQPGMSITVAGVDSSFNGTFVVTGIPTSTTLTYANTGTNVSSTASGGNAVITGGAGNLVFATDETGTQNKIIFAAGGLSSGTEQMSITPNENVHIEIATSSTSPTTGALTVVGGIGSQGSINANGTLDVNGYAYIGNGATTFASTADLTNPVATFKFDNNTADSSFAQLAFTNEDATSSTDIIVYMDNGDDSNGWMGMGIAGSDFDDATYGITGPGDGYIFHNAIDDTYKGNMVFATGEEGSENHIIFAAGGYSSGNTQLVIIPNETVHIEIPTESTSSTTGALVVAGGLGVNGNVNIAGDVAIAGTITFGGSGTTVETENLAVTDPIIFVGTGNLTDAIDLSFIGERAGVTTLDPTATIQTKSLATNVATLGLTYGPSSEPFKVGDSVVITGVDATFDGTHTLTAVGTSPVTISYTKVATNVSSTNATTLTARNVTTKSLSGGVATITTSGNHTFTTGEQVAIVGVDATFNGSYTITGTPTTTTFTYAKVAADVPSTPATTPYTSTISEKQLVGNVAILTASSPHGYLVGETVVVTGIDITFNGTYVITAVTSTTFSYGKVDSDVPTTSTSGSSVVNRLVGTSTATQFLGLANSTDVFRPRFTGIARDASDGGKFKLFDGLKTKPTTTVDFTDPDLTYASFRVGALESTTLNATGVITTSGGLTVPVGQTLTSNGTLTATGGVNLSGTVDVQELREAVVDITLASGTTGTLDWAAGNIYYIPTAPTGAMTFNLVNVPTDVNKIMTINVFVVQGSTGRIPSTFQIAGVGQTIRWPGGTAPTPTSTAGKIDIFSFTLQRTSGGAWIVYGSSSLNY
jgi:hypothetical protein